MIEICPLEAFADITDHSWYEFPRAMLFGSAGRTSTFGPSTATIPFDASDRESPPARKRTPTIAFSAT
jgi:hypothetical protein